MGLTYKTRLNDSYLIEKRSHLYHENLNFTESVKVQ